MQESQIRDAVESINSNSGLSKVKLTCPLETIPREILDLGDKVEQLDLSGTGLSSLPSDFGSIFPNLKIAFFSNCNFTVFPRELASCPNLEMVAFRHNGMVEIPEDVFPPRLRWLILTDNRIGALPEAIGSCARLEKCMLAGNQLRDLPSSMAQCKELALLRLNANRFESIPQWLFRLPKLAFLSFAGNPCVRDDSAKAAAAAAPCLATIEWADLEVQQTLGEGASGVISQGLWKQSPDYAEEVAIKLFRGALTSDGTPADEMAACLAAGAHESLITVLGRVHGHPDESDITTPPAPSNGATSDNSSTTTTANNRDNKFQGGVVMQLIPPSYTILGQPPSFATCTRDTFPPSSNDSNAVALMAKETTSNPVNAPTRTLSMLTGIAGAAAHLHERGIAHGDLYAHNILASAEDGHALLGDFGAATIYGTNNETYAGLEKLEVLAFAHLVEDVLGLMEGYFGEEQPAKEEGVEKEGVGQEVVVRNGSGVGAGAGGGGRDAESVRRGLRKIHALCASADVDSRPTFDEVVERLERMMGWSGMMRLEN